jgi:hypothetical protein
MSTCAICLDAIDVATTGCTTLSCKHEFHFSCISSWFLNTHNQSSCPCCRKVMTPMENFQADTQLEDDEDEDEEYDSEEDEDDEYCFFTYANFNRFLRSKGGRGVTMRQWMAMKPVNGEIAFYTATEVDFFLIGNGATGTMTEQEWYDNARIEDEEEETPKPSSMSHLMADGTWRTTILNPEDDTGVAVVLPENTPDDYGFHATVIANTSAKKLQNIWRSKRTYTLDQIERMLMA